MKPLKLTVKNIASFAGEHRIDFSLLGDMFLICGKTGSGKTTVLDSLTYALYGSLPGSRKQNDIRLLRSGFCGEQDECFAELDFLLNGKQYRIRRTLPVSRITRNGTLTESAEAVELHLIADNRAQLLSCQKSETDALIQSLLALSADEFSRIILLPQGDFAEFLRQKSSERKNMLAKLFPIERFTRTAEAVKEEKNRLDNMLEEVMNALNRLEKVFSTADAQNRIEEYEKNVKQSMQNCDRLRKNLLKIHTQIVQTEENLRQYREYEHINKELLRLDEQSGRQAEREKTLAHIRFALSIEPLLNAAEAAELQYNRIQKELSDTRQKLDTCTQKLSDMENRAAEAELNEKRTRELSLLIQNAEHALKGANDLDEAKQNAADIERSIQTADAEKQAITEKLNPLQQIRQKEYELRENAKKAEQNVSEAEYILLKVRENELKALQTSAKDTAEKARMILNDFLREKEHIDTNSAACFLAQHLQNGSPCPVCGSTEHPSPAVPKEQSLDLAEKIKTQEQLCMQAERSLRETEDSEKELQGRINQSKKNLPIFSDDFIGECEKKAQTLAAADAEQNLNHAQHMREQHAAHIRELEQACAQIQKYENELQVPEKRLIALEKDKAAAQARLLHTKQHLKELLSPLQTHIHAKEDENPVYIRKILEDLYNERNQAEKNVQAYREQRAQAEKEHAELSGKAKILHKDVLISETERAEAAAKLDAALADSPLSLMQGSSNTAEQAVRSVLELKNNAEDLERQIEAYKTEKRRLEIIREEKKAALPENPEQMERLYAELSEQKAQTERVLAEKEAHVHEIQVLLSDIRAKNDEFMQLEKRRKELFAALADYEKIHNAVSGKNPKKIQLESWILQMYLQEICFYAGKRLERISDGRYELYVKEAAGGRGYQGLDLEIYDNYTGKRRPCSTLSGGETFMASISLALAVSDTVQAKSGGVQLDSLFIDEGFGSLDDTALEKALSVLDEIRGSRCIGLVSHVAALKTRIGARLEIEKGITGSKIQCIV
ncbi:AAA family ATPase [Treponema sp. OMZ 840]|uniref:AAA family ATPase n=1 Tax=Treponema sp. OMZ 840 TaxID=244313 RepID=UPI003D8AB33A